MNTTRRILLSGILAILVVALIAPWPAPRVGGLPDNAVITYTDENVSARQFYRVAVTKDTTTKTMSGNITDEGQDPRTTQTFETSPETWQALQDAWGGYTLKTLRPWWAKWLPDASEAATGCGNISLKVTTDETTLIDRDLGGCGKAPQQDDLAEIIQ